MCVCRRLLSQSMSGPATRCVWSFPAAFLLTQRDLETVSIQLSASCNLMRVCTSGLQTTRPQVAVLDFLECGHQPRLCDSLVQDNSHSRNRSRSNTPQGSLERGHGFGKYSNGTSQRKVPRQLTTVHITVASLHSRPCAITWSTELSQTTCPQAMQELEAWLRR